MAISAEYAKNDVQRQPQEVFCKRAVLENVAKLTGSHLCRSFFINKVAGLRHVILSKKRLRHKCFPVNFDTFLRTAFLHNTSGQLLLNICLPDFVW